jgi:hypothetical protein
MAKPPKGDNFAGSDRKAAKLSKATATLEKFKDLKDLIGSFAPEGKMIKHKPKITTAPTSGRVKEEERNVSVAAFLYAASREADNDFHLIIGRDLKLAPEMYMTIEVSGLPPKGECGVHGSQFRPERFQEVFWRQIAGHDLRFLQSPNPDQD